jgi:hypothetical protein
MITFTYAAFALIALVTFALGISAGSAYIFFKK